MKQVLSSQELNKKFSEAKEQGDEMFASINQIKEDVTKKLSIINYVMEDNVVDKKIVFEELKEDTITIEYQIDNQVSIGTSRFNMIEIDPYISGSLDIQSIECYNLDTTGNLSDTPLKTISTINNIGKTRIILDEKIKFSKVVFTFKCNYSTKVNDIDIYPFGIKHILFKEADFLLDSFAIVELNSTDLIDYVYNDIILYSINGRIETTMDMYDIEIYTDYTKVLSGRIYPSTKAQVNRISKNTKKLYLKIPLIKQNKANDNKEYLSLTGIKINITTQKDIII